MASAQVSLTTIEPRSTSHIGVVRFAVTIGAAVGLIFVLCWIGTFISFASPTHAYIGLFTDAETQSTQALVEGGLWSLLFEQFDCWVWFEQTSPVTPLGHERPRGAPETYLFGL